MADIQTQPEQDFKSTKAFKILMNLYNDSTIDRNE
jgi:hypothetical protein